MEPEINHDDELHPSNSILVLLIRPSPSGHAPQADQTIRIHAQKTLVLDIKYYIFRNWSGKPKPDGIRLIARGRILNNSEVVAEALGGPPHDSSAHAIHVVVRPNAWTEKLTDSKLPSAPATPDHFSTSPPKSSSLPTPRDPTNEISASSSSPALNESNDVPVPLAHLFMAYFSNLTPYGKINFVQNILLARFKLTERVDHLRRQIHHHRLLVLGLTNASKSVVTPNSEQIAKHEKDWKVAEGKIVKLLKDLNAWNYPRDTGEWVDLDSSVDLDPLDQSAGEFKRIEIAGLPYLLYIPENLSRQPSPTGSTNSIAVDSPQKIYKTLQRELHRTLHIEAQVDMLILHAQKIQAGLNHLDYFITPGGIQHTANYYTQRFHSTINQPPVGPPPPIGIPHLPPVPFNPPAPGLAFGFGADGIHPPNNFLLPNGAVWPHPVARVRRYEFTINLDSIRRYLAPLLWLSLKLSVLLYIFGRHASASKLVILVMIAVGWVLWEAFSISQRHGAQARRRERLQRGQQVPGVGAPGGGPAVDPIQAVLDRGRRRAERDRLQQLIREQHQRVDGPLGAENQDPVVPPNNPQPAPLAPVEPPVAAAPALDPAPGRNAVRGLRAAAAHIRARGGAFPPGTEVRPFRNTSALSPKYWFNSIAVVGLASEYRELGLHSIGERALGASNLEYPRWYRYLRNTKTCLVLFFGTLLPEIEKKRRKALEKRARILNLVIADAARHDANHAPARNPDPARAAPLAVDNAQPAAAGTPKPTARPTSSSEVSESSSSRAAKPSEETENQLTPRATRATALERIPSGSAHERPSVRRSRLLVTDPSTSPPDPEPFKGDSSEGVSPCPDPPAPSSSSPASDPLLHAQPPVIHDPSVLQAPLTPTETPHVVGSLDDTDDEEIMGVDNEEPGMLLF